jgi:type III pantothenate kinase
MLLAVDIGNSNVKFGLWTGESWLAVWRVRTQQLTAAEYSLLLQNYAANDQIDLNNITGVVISSVVPTLTPVMLELAQQMFQIDAYVMTTPSLNGLTLALDAPEQVGTDRLLNVTAAFALLRGAVIVVDLGTATKFDVVTSGAVYRGGAIAPGIAVSNQAMADGIALLPHIELNNPHPPIIGTTTSTALQSGLIWGMVSMVEGMLKRLQTALNEPEVRVIITGGLVPLIQPHLSAEVQYLPTLTLDGLRLIYERQRRNIRLK